MRAEALSPSFIFDVMNTHDLPPGCEPLPSCLDYQSFVFQLTPQSDVSRLCGLGRVERADLGVIYVRAEWGFLVLPPAGFPELRVSFYRQVGEDRVLAWLDHIGTLLAG